MRNIRTLAWAAIAALLVAVGVVLYARLPAGGGLPLAATIGGPFELTTHEGKRLSAADLKGRPFAMFFGFTFCPDVCPTTLLELTNVIRELGPDADKMRFLFVTVDPERDTPEQLKLYVSNFDPHITGLTGSAADIANVARAYRAYYEKVPTKDGYTMNHSAITYLMDKQGQFFGTIAYQEKHETQVAKLKRLVAQK